MKWVRREERLRNAVTFFISNLLNDCTSTRLWQAFFPLGNLGNAFIPKKRDGAGNRFGFIRLKEVEDVEMWLEKLKTVTIDGAIIGVNVARFTRDGPFNQGTLPMRKDLPVRNGSRFKEGDDDRSRVRVPVPNVNLVGTSKATTWKGVNVLKKVGNGGIRDLEEKNVVLVNPSITEANEKWKGKSLIAKVKSLELLNTLETFLSRDNMLGAKTSFVGGGGLKILICFNGPETAMEFFTNQKFFWEVWAKNMEVWNGQDLEFSRLVWLIVRGIPLELWDKGVFNSIGERFGRIVQPSEASSTDWCLAFNKMAIVVNHRRKINEEVVIVWRDRRVKIWVVEEEGEWSPNFIC
ncbi:putative RNA recognition motif domain, nucleotide-binding alpha-beta plait domain superfamily [Helianthus annuus]|nr:putative RNA recognition motif domain, nucleotide-binding alpha-beta plait domain superfamily [Helianthus annuus]